MRKIVKRLGVTVALLSATPLIAAWPGNVTVIDAKKGSTETKGTLSAGAPIPLEWAAASSMACFTAPAFPHYQGNHTFFATTIPPRSKMKITVTPTPTPKDPKADINVYAYMIADNGFRLPPEITSAVTCEASPDSGKAAKPGPETIKLNNPKPKGSFNVLIGVAGAKGVVGGDFNVTVTLEQ